MKRILVIDDVSEVRSFIRDVLEDTGYFVIEADNGNTGIAAFRQNPVDLVIVDLYMPEKEGIETIIELRKGYPDLKIVAISGGIPRFGRDNLLQSAQLLGADCCLSKPFTARELLDLIERLPS